MRKLLPLFLLPAGLVPQTAPRAPQFENDDVRVWKTTLMPKVELPAHRHDHPRVVVALTGGTVRMLAQPGGPEMHTWETGKAYWLPPNPPGQTHVESNVGDKPIEVMVVELEKAK